MNGRFANLTSSVLAPRPRTPARLSLTTVLAPIGEHLSVQLVWAGDGSQLSGLR